MIHSMQLAIKQIEEEAAIRNYVNEEGPRLRTQINTLEQQLTSKDQMISSLQNQLSQANSNISSYTSQIRQKDAAIQDLQSKSIQKKTELDRLQQDYERQLSLKQNEINGHLTQIADLSDTVQDLHKIIAAQPGEQQQGSTAVEGIPVSSLVDVNSPTDASTMLGAVEEGYTMVEY